MVAVQAAFPRIFKRAYPALDPNTPILPALSLLRFHEIDALPIASVTGVERRAVFGFSGLSRLMTMGPKGFAKFLKEPCESASDVLASVDAADSLARLLDTFWRTKFGFAWVDGRDDVGGLITLNDVLELYGTGGMQTKLRIADVASPIFSMPETSSLHEALKAMFSKRYRKLFLGGRSAFISDRTIIDYLFSPAVLKSISLDSQDVLETNIGEIGSIVPRKVSSNLSIKSGAQELRGKRGQCLVCHKGVVTPWDLIMKPWKSKELKIARGIHMKIKRAVRADALRSREVRRW